MSKRVRKSTPDFKLEIFYKVSIEYIVKTIVNDVIKSTVEIVEVSQTCQKRRHVDNRSINSCILIKWLR